MMADSQGSASESKRSNTKSITVEDVKKWPEIGDTYNEDWGVDDVRAKKINGYWAYVQLEWRYHVASTGFIFYKGKQLKALTDLQPSDSEAKLRPSKAQSKALQDSGRETHG